MTEMLSQEKIRQLTDAFNKHWLSTVTAARVTVEKRPKSFVEIIEQVPQPYPLLAQIAELPIPGNYRNCDEAADFVIYYYSLSPEERNAMGIEQR
jgi:hypothetical protein